MTSAATAQVRLVRCPKCRKVLLESPELPVYKCGGCGVVLQAKNRKNGKSLSSGSLEKSTCQQNQLERDSEYVKSTGSDQMENQCDTKEYSSNLNAKVQTESADCSIEPSENRSLNGVSSCESECLSNLNAQEQLEHDSEGVNSTSSVQIENRCDKKECSSNLNAKEQVESADSSIEPSGSRNFVNGVSSGDSECSSDLNAKEQTESADCSIDPSGNRSLNGVFLCESECLSNLNAKDQLEHDAEGVNSTSSVQIENNCDKKECSSVLNAKEQVESVDCSIEPSESRNFLNGASSGDSECSSDLNVKEQIESTDCSIEQSGSRNFLNGVSLGNSLDLDKGKEKIESKEQVESAVCSIEPSESRNFLNGVFSGDSECSSDMTAKEQIESWIELPVSRNFLNGVSLGNSLDLDNGKEQIESTEQVESADCSIEPSGSRNFFNGVSLGDSECSSDLNAKEQIESTDCSTELPNFVNGVSSGDSLDLDNGKEQIESGECNIKESGSRGFLKGISSGDFSCHQREEKSSEAGRNTQIDENDEIQSPDSQLSSRGKSSSPTSQRQSDESKPMKMNFASLNEQLLQSQENSHHESDHTRSVDTVETSGTIDNGNNSGELSGTPGDISKSPTTRSCHAYDGSVSSFDEWDDQILEQPSHPPKRSWFKRQVVSEVPSNKERPRREDGLMNKKIGEKHGLNWKGSRIQAKGQVGSLDSDGLRPIKNWMRIERDGFWSRETFQRGFPTVYENGSPSNYRHEEFSCSTSAYSSSKVDYFDPMELLRKLDELRDQLSRSYNHRGMANGRFSARITQQEKQQRCYDANYHRHPFAPYWPRKNECQKCEFSPMLFSGQGTNCRNNVGYSCYHCCPEDRLCQTQLSPSSPCCNNGPFRGHSAPMCYKHYGSSSATQQKHIDSCFSLQGCQMHSQDQGLMDHQKKYHQDRRQPIKRHFRPIAGGAPYIICYMCCALLQLPEDFISQKRIHHLQCSACSQVLKFSLQNRTHIFPYNPNPAEPPPTEVDNGSVATTGRNLVSISHANDSIQWEPVSYSEDCGPSMGKSCSTESDLPFPILQGNADDKEQPSSSYSEAKVEGKNQSVFKESGNNYRTSIEASESTSASSNVIKVESSSLQGKVAPRRSGSPLHQLLGYSSARELING